MEIYNYDHQTGYFIGVSEADPDPLVPDNWLIPAYATALVPPAREDGTVQVFFNGAWVLQSVMEPPPHEPEDPNDPFPQPEYPPLAPLDFKLGMLTINVTPDDVDGVIAGMQEPDRTVAKIYWTSAGHFLRDDPLIPLIAGELGKTDAEINYAWKQASTPYEAPHTPSPVPYAPWTPPVDPKSLPGWKSIIDPNDPTYEPPTEETPNAG
jgi:hypothetical protein